MASASVRSVVLVGALAAVSASTYVDGPRVSNEVGIWQCYTQYGTLQEAEALCDGHASCTVLHDYSCDGAGWRHCWSSIQDLAVRAAGTAACTKVTAAPGEESVYSDGPRVSNAAVGSHCSGWYGSLLDATARCSSNSSCSVIHDFSCDGIGWRFCLSSIAAIQGAGADTLACTMVRDAGELASAAPTTTSTAAQVALSEGPRVSNGAFSTHCSSRYGTLAEARSLCSGDADCTFLHDYNCDGGGWRHCVGSLGAIAAQGAGTRACTMAVAVPEERSYVEGPRVGNSASASSCSTWWGSLQEAREGCDADPGCSVLHDYNCDGWGWRFCTQPLATIQGSHAGTRACTRLAEDVTATTSTAPGASYAEGPRVSNAAYMVHCDTRYGELAAAQKECDEDSSCTVLHDFNCDGRGWRHCTRGIQSIEDASAALGGGTEACTMVAAGAAEQAFYVDGPRVSNSAHLQGSCAYAGSLSEAQAHCDPGGGCQVLHDFDCDGRGWRRCGRDIGMLVSAGNGTAACTQVVSAAPSTHWTCSAIADPAAHLVDVRQQWEWDQGHMGCATLLPLQDVTQANVDELTGRLLEAPVLIYCQSGRRAQYAVDLIRTWGYRNVHNFMGLADLQGAGCAC